MNCNFAKNIPKMEDIEIYNKTVMRLNNNCGVVRIKKKKKNKIRGEKSNNNQSFVHQWKT